MKRKTKQSSQEQEQIAEVQSGQVSAREFASAEELIRHDADQIVVPPEVAERLAQSTRSLPKPAQSWWRRFLDR